MIENMLWIVLGDRLIETVLLSTQKQVLALKLMDGIVSPVCLVGGWLSYLQMKKNVMDAHGSRLLGYCSFGHPGQMLKWMDGFESFSNITHIFRTV